MLSSALTVGLIPSASSQQYTTSTSVFTSSFSQTTTAYSYAVTSVTVTGTGTDTETASFSNFAQCNIEVGVLDIFGASGVTHFEYSASGPMTLYVMDEATMNSWLTFSSFLTSQCEPLGGNWIRYRLGSAYPLQGSFDLNLPSNYYAVVFAAPSTTINPTAMATVSPVAYAQVTSMTSTTSMIYVISGTTTLTFSTVLEVPFMQTYGSWIVTAIAILAIAALIVWLTLKRRLKPRRRKRQS